MNKLKRKVEFKFTFSEYFYRLSKNQKLAVINFLSVLAVSDRGPKMNNDKACLINKCYKEFRVSGDEFLEYTAIGGREQTVLDIKRLNNENFFGLILITEELFGLNGRTSDDEFYALEAWLDEMGMTIEEWYNFGCDDKLE